MTCWGAGMLYVHVKYRDRNDRNELCNVMMELVQYINMYMYNG